MSGFDLSTSLERLEARFERPRGVGTRSDRGQSRLDPAVERHIRVLLLTQEKPSLVDAQRRLKTYCERRGLTVPSRATLYNAIDRVVLPSVSVDELPKAVRSALYNLELREGDAVAMDHLALYAFNYGDARALSFAAGLPWLALLRASKLTGWRPKSRALLNAVMGERGIATRKTKTRTPRATDNSLDVMGILATKTHALLDRGLRRDFFDLYVMLQLHSLGLADCLRALRELHGAEVNDGLVLRALAYFDDAEAGPALPGEGKGDWEQVKGFFSRAVAALVVPPSKALQIQSRVVDVRG